MTKLKKRMVNPERLIKPDDKFHEYFPGLDFRETYCFQSTSEPVLITDPTYLADVYNSKDEVASFLRTNGVIVMNFGGDVGGPVWFQNPYILIPISMHLFENNYEPPENITVMAEGVGTDSGSFIFLPLTKAAPIDLRNTIENVIDDKNGVLLKLPSGNWVVYYEQFDTPEGSYATFYRNIVARLEE